MIGRKKCTTSVCRRTCKDDGRFYVWICGRCLKAVDAEIREEWKRRRAVHTAFMRRWRAKTKPSPYRLPRANRRAALALLIEANAGFLMAVQDARIKRAMEAC